VAHVIVCSQNSRDRDTAWDFIPTDTPDVYRLQNITCTTRFLSRTDGVDNKLYVPDSGQMNNPENWNWEVEWDADQIYSAKKNKLAPMTVPGRNRAGLAVAFGSVATDKLYCGRTGVIEQPKPVGQSFTIPADYKTLMLTHQSSGWYAQRGGSHFNLTATRTVMCAYNDTSEPNLWHIRGCQQADHMRHYGGDWDNYTQSSRDNDTKWIFLVQPDGSYWIQNWSNRDRYLSCDAPGQVDNKLFVPTVRDQSETKHRNWLLEFDAPQALAAETYPDRCGPAEGKQCADCEWANAQDIKSCLNEEGREMKWGTNVLFCGVGECTAEVACMSCKVTQAQVLTNAPGELRIAQTCRVCAFVNPIGVLHCGLCAAEQVVELKKTSEDENEDPVDWANLVISATNESVTNLWTWNAPSSLERAAYPNSAEMNLYLAQHLRVLLRCSYENNFRTSLTDKKWVQVLMTPFSAGKFQAYALAHDQLLLRLVGRVLPYVAPTSVSGETFVTNLLERIGEGVCPDKLLTEEKVKAENDSKDGAAPKTDHDLEFYMRGLFAMECTTELVDLYRSLYSSTQASYGDDWRALVEQNVTQSLASLSTASSLRTSFAALAVLGGLVDPVRVGARVMHEGQPGTVVDWTFFAKDAFVKTLRVRLDGGGDEVDLKSLNGVQVIPNQPVPYHRMDAKQVLLTLINYCTAERKGTSGRQKLSEAIARRQTFKIISDLVQRPVWHAFSRHCRTSKFNSCPLEQKIQLFYLSRPADHLRSV